MARQGDALSTQAAQQSCSCTWACICSACRVAHEKRRASEGRAAPHLVGLRGRRAALSGSWPSWSAPCMPSTQPIRTATLPPLLGRAGDSFIPLDEAIHGRRVRDRKIEEKCPTYGWTRPTHGSSHATVV